ncbi:MAG: hypothetical protein NVSMB48_14360 [Marmoricola sp.]
MALALLILGTGTLATLGTPAASAVAATVIEPASTCRRFDPNIGSGACLRFPSRSGSAYTWIGTYRTSSGVSFFCIDFLYDSRISASSARVAATGLRNQFNRPIGAAEVAALNALISARAPSGGAGSWAGNAAIALIIREVMSDGIRSDGTILYPPGLKVGGTVKAMPGGTPSPILSLAQQWWREASAARGPWTVRLDATNAGQTVPLGSTATYRVRVVSAAGRDLPGVFVKLSCSGPVSCPAGLTTAATPTSLQVRPTALGDYVVTAAVSGPSAQGQLLQGAWSPHGGTAARNNGVQRGWIVQRAAAAVSALGAAHIVKAAPGVVTQAQPTARSGSALSDLVMVTGLPSGYDHPLSATLYGPFAARPTTTSCTADKAVATVRAPVTTNGALRTPPVAAARPGYYVWTESLPGDDLTNPVQTPCGLVQETTLVSPAPILDRPTLHTEASASRLTVPGSVFDTISVRGLKAGETTLAWTLLGPISPGPRGCVGLNWAHAPVRASGSLHSGNGTVRTPSVRLTVAGCYTFTERSTPTAGAGAAESPAGLPGETVLGARAPLPIVPEVPTGPVSPDLPGWWTLLGVA